MPSSINKDAVKILNRVQEPRGEKALRIMANLYPHLNAICNTEIGIEILRDDLQCLEDIMLKICKGDDLTVREKSMFDYLVTYRLPKIYDRLKNYLQLEMEIG